MLLVQTKVKKSNISGLGLFADQYIRKGTVIWKYTPGFDLSVSKSELIKLSRPSKKQFIKYSYFNLKTKKYVLCFDDARFFNHSANPNIVEIPDGSEGINIAGRNIHKGEELTCDYRLYDGETKKKLKNNGKNS